MCIRDSAKTQFLIWFQSILRTAGVKSAGSRQKRRNPISIAPDKFHTEMANDIALFFMIGDFARSRKDWCYRTLQRIFRFSHRIPYLNCWKVLLHVLGHKNNPEDSLADWLRKNKNHRRNLTLIASDGLLPLINALCDFGKVHCLHFFWLILKSG